MFFNRKKKDVKTVSEVNKDDGESEALEKVKTPSTFKVDLEDVYVINADYIPSHNDGMGFGPLFIGVYYIVRKVEDKYYNVFSGEEIEDNGTSFDLPSLNEDEIHPIFEYLKDKDEKKIDSSMLYWLVNDLNMTMFLDWRKRLLADEEEEN